MQNLLTDQNQHQTKSIGQLVHEAYQSLSYGQKRRLLVQYLNIYGAHPATFYRKVNGTVRIRRHEQGFFNQHLNLQK